IERTCRRPARDAENVVRSHNQPEFSDVRIVFGSRRSRTCRTARATAPSELTWHRFRPALDRPGGRFRRYRANALSECGGRASLLTKDILESSSAALLAHRHRARRESVPLLSDGDPTARPASSAPPPRAWPDHRRAAAHTRRTDGLSRASPAAPYLALTGCRRRPQQIQDAALVLDRGRGVPRQRD